MPNLILAVPIHDAPHDVGVVALVSHQQRTNVFSMQRTGSGQATVGARTQAMTVACLPPGTFEFR